MKKPFALVFFICLFTCAYSFPLLHGAQFSPSSSEMIRSNLYVVGSNTTTLLDGDLTQYDPSYSDAVDGLDARKMSNFSENIGMQRQATTLVIERRQTIEDKDSIFYKIWNLQQQRAYRLEFITSNLNHPGLTGYVEDKYLHTNTPLDLNGSNYVNFTVNADPASTDMYRFRIIFTKAEAGLLPLTFTSVKASLENTGVAVAWQTVNESNIKEYTIQRSSDGNFFKNMGNIKAANLSQNKYGWNDHLPVTGDNFYRIQSAGIDGEIKYSTIVKINNSKNIRLITAFPNPVVGNLINLQFISQPSGDYTIQLKSLSGQSIVEKHISHTMGTDIETVPTLGALPKGMYMLQIISPNGNKTDISLIF